MGYDEFQEWIDKNIPAGEDRQAFLEYLAMCGAFMMQKAMENTGKSLQDLIDFSFADTGHLHDA